jgi:pimeloyl-ACP methyl ester carboxylesterase
LDKKPLKKLRLLILVLFAVLAISAIGFVIWAQTPLGPMPEAIGALESDNWVQINRTTWIEFRPETGQPGTGFILYPGGRVDHRSYAPLARRIAEEGYLVVIAPMPLNLAVFSPNRAARVIEAYPEIENWAVGGHSLGGAMAASYSGSNLDRVRGLVLWASYPPGSTDLSASDLEVVSIYGSNDSVLSSLQHAESRALLPSTTSWVLIEGGNHAQFGWYGLQPGDGEAAISRIDQQNQIVAATLDLLENIESSR